MTEFWLFVSMENYFIPFVVWKTRTCWNQIFRCLNFKHLLFHLIPYENLCVFHTFISLSKIILEMSLTLSFCKVAFSFLFFDLSHINPSVLVVAKPWHSKNIILENFIVFSFYWNWIKTSAFLNSALFIIFKSFWDGFELGSNLNLINGKKNLFWVFGIGIRSTERIIKFEKWVGDHLDSSRCRESPKISLNDWEDRFHQKEILIFWS